MIGDVNLFLMDDMNDINDMNDMDKSEKNQRAEIEIMIADSEFRGQGLGTEAVKLMIQYGIQTLGIKTFEAKIGMDNPSSISLFKKLGFYQISESVVFNQVTLEYIV